MNLLRPFFGFLILILDAAFPFVYAITVKLNNEKCNNCGVLNSYKLTDQQMDDLGTKHKFHNEGGYTRTVKTSIGVVVQDVPTTAVYDGEFNTTRVTKTYNCSACGAIKVNSEKIETKV